MRPGDCELLFKAEFPGRAGARGGKDVGGVHGRGVMDLGAAAFPLEAEAGFLTVRQIEENSN